MPDHSHLAAATILLIALAYAALAPGLRSRPRAKRRALDRLARRVRLPVPDALRPRLERQLLSHRLGADLGGAVAVAITAVWGLTFGRDTVSDVWWLLILFAGAMAGAAVGTGTAALREAARPRSESGPRVARPVAPTLDDYVAPVELQGGRLVGVLPAVLLAALLVLVATGVTTSALVGPAVATVLALAAVAFGELGGRRVLDAPQAAGSDLELAWGDAIRAHTLRAIVTVPIVVGTYASLGVLSAFDLDLQSIEPRSPIGIGLAALLMGTIAAGVTVVIWSATGSPHRYFSHRLWRTGRPSHGAASSRGRQ